MKMLESYWIYKFVKRLGLEILQNYILRYIIALNSRLAQ